MKFFLTGSSSYYLKNLFPESHVERKRILLSEIFTSYFEKDVKTLADFRDLSKLRDLILLLVRRIGSRFEISKLASELSISRETVYTYLAFLEQTYFISHAKEGGNEIDFIVDERIGLEVKTASSRRDNEHLKRRAQGIDITECYVVALEYSNDKETILGIDI